MGYRVGQEPLKNLHMDFDVISLDSEQDIFEQETAVNHFAQLCLDHEELATRYCIECKEIICDLCTNDHLKHQFKSISEHRNSLVFELSRLQNVLDDLNTNELVTSQWKSELQEYQKECINTLENEYQLKVRQLQQEYVNEKETLTQVHGTALKLLNEKIENVSMRKSQLKSLVSGLEKAKDHPNPFVLVRECKDFQVVTVDPTTIATEFPVFQRIAPQNTILSTWKPLKSNTELVHYEFDQARHVLSLEFNQKPKWGFDCLSPDLITIESLEPITCKCCNESKFYRNSMDFEMKLQMELGQRCCKYRVFLFLESEKAIKICLKLWRDGIELIRETLFLYCEILTLD
jgi:hypothetical protein